ncbi:MAG TPA: hypothetical protein VJ625_00525 [Propionibacteriaceae bacterium]|nr:hypothetical protein [Propionibacteriaceae bacterium]
MDSLSFEELEEVCLAGYQSGWRMPFARRSGRNSPGVCSECCPSLSTRLSAVDPAPALLDEAKRPPMEAVHPRPFDEIIDLWGAANSTNIRLAVTAPQLANP